MARTTFITILTVFLAYQVSYSTARTGRDLSNLHREGWSSFSNKENNENRADLACQLLNDSLETRIRECAIDYGKLGRQEYDYTCNFNLEVTEEGSFIAGRPVMWMFGKDKVIVMWKVLGPNKYLQTRIIWPDGCKMIDTKIPDQSPSWDFRLDFRFAFGNRSFDLFFHQNDTCKDKICWMTVNDEGKIINGPIGYYKASYGYLPSEDVGRIDEDAPEKGHVFRHWNDGIDYFLRKPDGMEKLLAHSKGVSKTAWYFDVSLANNLIGTCFRIDTETCKCAQYDTDGKLKLEVNLDRPHTVYNIPKGGLYITERVEDKIYQIIKTDENGTKIGNFECFGPVWEQDFYINDEGKHCLKVNCFNFDKPDVKCFDDEIFLKD